MQLPANPAWRADWFVDCKQKPQALRQACGLKHLCEIDYYSGLTSANAAYPGYTRSTRSIAR